MTRTERYVSARTFFTCVDDLMDVGVDVHARDRPDRNRKLYRHSSYSLHDKKS